PNSTADTSKVSSDIPSDIAASPASPNSDSPKGSRNRRKGKVLQMSQVTFLDLKADPGRIGVDSMLREIAKLQRLRQITAALPPNLFAGVSPKLLQRYRDRVASEPVRE